MKDNKKKNIIWNTVGMTLNSFNSLIFLVIINRVNGIDPAGIFSFAFSLACLLYVIGIYSGRSYQVSDIKKSLNDSEYLAHKCLSCLLMVFVCFIYIRINDYSFEKKLIIIILTLYKLLDAFSDTLYGYYQKKDALYIAGISMFIKSFVAIVAFAIIDFATRNLVLSCVSIVVVNMVLICTFDFYYTRKYADFEKVKFKNVNHLFLSGFSIFAFSFLSIFIVNAPKYVIDYLLTDASQAIFNIIIMPATVISLCGQYIMGPSLNSLVKLYSEKKFKEYKKSIYKIVKLLSFLGAVIEAGAFLLGIPVLNVIYAIDLNSYKLDLLIIIFGGVLYAIANILSTGLITMRKNNIQLLIYSISSVGCLGLSYLFISKIGIHGATYAYFLTMVINLAMYLIYFNYECKQLMRATNESSVKSL